ncbi:hypothetical protein EYC80_006834 [Monilinia laxa]|uniref:Uncharacterized protein n=1 Tax=Monilinia laxa TaxID=61186 RepID=A0A5N6JZC4_MONLA|nr:hypothetical protein EYC80_006834 [Monilinia laxa]
METPSLNSLVSMTDSLIDLDVACEDLPKSGKPGTQSSNTDDLWNNLFIPDNELVEYHSSDSPNQVSSSLTAKNLEVLSNSINTTTSKHRKKSSRASTDHSGSVEEVVKQEEHLDRQVLPIIEKSESDTTIANIIALCRNSGPLKLNCPHLDIVGDIVGRLVHFDLRDPTFPRSYHFGPPPPPVAGKHGLLSWLTSQEKMAGFVIETGSYDFFRWGWSTAIFSRSVRLGVRASCKVPYLVKLQTGRWYYPEPKEREVRDRAAWDILQQPKSGDFTNSETTSSETTQIPYEFRALAKDFFSGKLVHEPDYYARLVEPEKLADDRDATEKLFHITKIDMGKYRQNLYRNLYGPNREILESSKEKNASGIDHVVNLFLLEVIKNNEIEDALALEEKNTKQEKSSFTVASLHGTDVRRSSRYHEYIDRLNILEHNKKEASKNAARLGLEDFARNIDVHGLDSIMGSETWSVTHISTIPTLDEPAQEVTIIESIHTDGGNRSTSPLSIPENVEPKNETTPKKKKKKKTKGKSNTKKFENNGDEKESIDSAAAVGPTCDPTESSAETFLSIASDPLNYDFGDSENPIVDEEPHWETVKARPSKPKGLRATPKFDQARSAKQYNRNAGRKRDMTSRDSPTAASTTKIGEKFEVESLNEFPAIAPPKQLLIKKLDGHSGEIKVVMQQQALPAVGLELSASGDDNHVIAQTSGNLLPLLSTKKLIISGEVAAEDIYKVDKSDSSTVFDASWALTASPSEDCSSISGLNLKDHAPIYLGGMLGFPSQAPRLRHHRRSCSADARILTSTTLVMNRPASGCVNVSYTNLVDDNTAAADTSSTADSISRNPVADNIVSAHSLSAVDSISTDAVVGTVTDSASLATVVNNALKAEDLCSLEAYSGTEAGPLPREPSPISVNGSASVTGSTMTIYRPQPRGFGLSFMGLGPLNVELTVLKSVSNQTQDQQTSVVSYDVEEQNVSQFSNGWSQLQLSASTILHAGQHTPVESDPGCTPFDCTYCAKHCYANAGSPMVSCHGCGTNSGINYCSVACLLAGSLSHADGCQENLHDSEMLLIDTHLCHQIYYSGPLVLSSSDEDTNKKSTYAYRQKVFVMHCRDGPFPRLLRAWARKNSFTLESQDLNEASQETGSYYIFKSGLTSNGSRMNPDSTVICTIKFQPGDNMKQIVARCLRACLSSHCKNNIKEFLFRLIKNYLSDEDSFAQFPHTEDRTTVFYEFQHQFHLEFGFHADMQQTSSDNFNFELEWPLVEYLLSQFEIGELV